MNESNDRPRTIIRHPFTGSKGVVTLEIDVYDLPTGGWSALEPVVDRLEEWISEWVRTEEDDDA